MIYQHLYLSSASEGLETQDLENILETARACNLENGVTGVLIYGQRVFVHCLEGEKPKVLETFERIKKDRRHRNVVTLFARDVPERAFADWSMGFEELHPRLRKRLADDSTSDLSDDLVEIVLSFEPDQNLS